ncbi:flagellar hook-associated protein FlgL [Stenotrophomonas sp. UBA7606]|uniref:flagellar hook-associated protein FlgL n=1 Tax=Stenotrophomonas sp. UBA7606 TaxID=1947559 RepID=UPI0025E09CE3|nr:flagellar hook-associated protein FlgL [Stenotrophomonas sp. UBA7606]
MMNRISSNMMYDQSVALMLSKQSKLNHLEQQLSTGKKIVSAKDDPVGSGTAVGMDRVLAELEKLGSNANTAQNRLGLQENVLSQAGELLQQVSDLTVQANNPALSNEDRKGVANELKAIKDSLLALANTTDGSGRYLFGGAADANAPFTVSNGIVSYNGDQTQRQVEVAPGTFIKDALPGSEIFMRVRTGDGTVDGAAASANTGQAVLTDISRDGSGSWDGSSYSLHFTAADTYEVRDARNAVIGTGTYASGEDITFEGLRVRIEGTPAAGDTFNAGQAGTRDVFATIDQLVQTLQMDASTRAGRTAQQNALQGSIRDVRRASELMIDARAAGGAQLAAADDAASLREANTVTLQTSLSQMRDLNYADAIGQYKLEGAALQAAQTIFTQMQSMSLFNMIR